MAWLQREGRIDTVQADLQELLDFLEQQKVKQVPHFPAVRFDKVLSFMGTTSQAGTHAAMGICPVHALLPEAEQELRIHLRGPLPRPPARGECITVHLTSIDQYQGYQVKSRPMGGPDSAPSLYEDRGVELVVKGSQIFTVHHSPYTMKFFEQIPFDEVRQMVGGCRFALVAVGETANISPRFVFHIETRGERVVLYHGDGLALKTYMNLRSNRQESRLVLDLDDYSGYLLRGTVEEFQPHQNPEAYERICQGFTAGNWGKPSRAFRLVVDAWEKIAPTGEH
jgi:hypothetical protein